MKLDAELELWRDQWQSASEAPALAELSKLVARQSLHMRLMLLADILVTAVIGGGVIFYAMRDPRPATVVLVAATWLFITVAWIFALSNRKNAWSPSASTTAAFLDLSIRRCRGNLRASLFGAVLYVIEMAFCLSWLYRETVLARALIISIALLTLILAALLLIYRKKKLADLSYLLNLQSELTTE